MDKKRNHDMMSQEQECKSNSMIFSCPAFRSRMPMFFFLSCGNIVVHNEDRLSIELTACLKVQEKKTKAAKEKVARLFSEQSKMAAMLAIEKEGFEKATAAIEEEREGIEKATAAIEEEREELRRREEKSLREEEETRRREEEVMLQEIKKKYQKQTIENLRETHRAALEDWKSAMTDHESERHKNERLEGIVKQLKETLLFVNQPNEASKRA